MFCRVPAYANGMQCNLIILEDANMSQFACRCFKKETKYTLLRINILHILYAPASSHDV